MEKQEIKKLGVVFLFILGIAIFMDITGGKLLTDGTLSRDEVGGDVRGVSLILDAEGVLENYAYEVEVEPQRVTEQQAADYFTSAIEIITSEFSKEWTEMPIRESYLEGIVEAEWVFSPVGYLFLRWNYFRGGNSKRGSGNKCHCDAGMWRIPADLFLSISLVSKRLVKRGTGKRGVGGMVYGAAGIRR